jgi:phosphohistidine phosphatase
MRLILMRHAEAGDPDPWRWPDDRDRALTEEGRIEHRAVAETLRRMGVRFDRLLSSPLARARQTAEITAEAYERRAPIEQADALGDRSTPEGFFARLRECERNATVLCVGHEPHLSRLAAILIAGDPRPRIEMRKSGVIVIDCDGYPASGNGTLCLHLRPRELMAFQADD